LSTNCMDGSLGELGFKTTCITIMLLMSSNKYWRQSSYKISIRPADIALPPICWASVSLPMFVSTLPAFVVVFLPWLGTWAESPSRITIPGQDLLKPLHNLIPGVGQGILVRAANYKTKEFYFFDFLHIADLLWPITLVFPGADTNHFRLLVSAQNGPRSFLELLHDSIKLNQVFYMTGDSLNQRRHRAQIF